MSGTLRRAGYGASKKPGCFSLCDPRWPPLLPGRSPSAPHDEWAEVHRRDQSNARALLSSSALSAELRRVTVFAETVTQKTSVAPLVAALQIACFETGYCLVTDQEVVVLRSQFFEASFSKPGFRSQVFVSRARASIRTSRRMRRLQTTIARWSRIRGTAAAAVSDGASRARTGDLLGAITTKGGPLTRLRLGQAIPVELSSVEFAQFGSTVGSTGRSLGVGLPPPSRRDLAKAT
jgi:hypothetical protein